MEEENKAVVRRVIEGFLNSGDPGVANELFSPDYRDNTPSNPGMGGLENIKRSVADWQRAFPDTVNAVEDLLAEGDRVAARWVTRGTHRGELAQCSGPCHLPQTSGAQRGRPRVASRRRFCYCS